MLLSCDNMAKEHLEGSDLEDRETGMKTTLKEKNKTTLGRITFPCVKTHGNMFQNVAHLTKCPRNTKKQMCQVQQHQVEKKQVTLLGKPQVHILYLPEI